MKLTLITAALLLQACTIVILQPPKTARETLAPTQQLPQCEGRETLPSDVRDCVCTALGWECTRAKQRKEGIES